MNKEVTDILQEIVYGTTRCQSIWKWPNTTRPTKSMWKKWNQYISYEYILDDEDHMLHSPFSEWKLMPYHLHHPTMITTENNLIQHQPNHRQISYYRQIGTKNSEIYQHITVLQFPTIQTKYPCQIQVESNDQVRCRQKLHPTMKNTITPWL